MESTHRSMAKAVSWRLLSLVGTTTVIWAATGRPGLAATVGAGEFLAKLAAYYGHERLWNRIRFGRQGGTVGVDGAGGVQ